MGANIKNIIYFFEMAQVGGILDDFDHIAVCDIGDLSLRGYAKTTLHKYFGRYFSNFRDFLSFLQIPTTSIDIKGKESLNLDLRIPISEDLKEKYNIVFNAGTTEHVYTNQYQVFKNIHDLCKVNGIIIHIVPYMEIGHGFWYYKEDFFFYLTKKCRYSVLDYRITPASYKAGRKLYFFITMKKVEDSIFMKEEEWINPAVDNIGVERFAEDYDKFIERYK